MSTIRFPFHHAVQHTSGEADVTVTSGDLKIGYEKAANYNAFNLNSTKHYWVDFYFSIPSDAYKYTYQGYAKPLFQTETKTRIYSKEVHNSSVVQYFIEDKEYASDAEVISDMFEGITHLIPPGEPLTHRFYFDESAFNTMQTSESEYVDYITPTTSGGTNEHQTYDGDTLDVYQKSGLLKTLKDVENTYIEFEATEAEMFIAPTYPVDIYARNDRDLTVAWTNSNNINRDDDYFYVTGSTIKISDSDSHSVTKTVTGSDSYKVFSTSDISSLSTGACTVKVDCTTNYGDTITKTWSFELVGETDAPEITWISSNSYPEIVWQITNQTAFEIRISDSSGIVYDSGMIPSTTLRRYQIPQLLEDGEYSVEMRCINQYGYITEWGSFYLDLHPAKPDPPGEVLISAREDFGIIGKAFQLPLGQFMLVRRKDSNSKVEKVVDWMPGEDAIDYFVGLNDPHEYTIRVYTESWVTGGYSDGEWFDGVLNYDGIVIRDADDYSRFVHVWMSEDRDIKYRYDEQRSDVLTRCVGRDFPVAEQGEWQTSTRTFTGYVSGEEFVKLQYMKKNSTHVLFQGQKEYFPCYFEFSDQGEYINGGRIVSFQLTRIDGDR